MQVKEARVWVKNQLANAGFVNGEWEAVLLVAHLCGCEPRNLPLNLEKDVSERRLREFVSRRKTNEPLQYIIGETEFMGLTFKVNPDVLIPRADSECLVERAMSFWSSYSEITIADIGSGSGALAVSLAHYLPQAHVYGVDISEQAVNIATANAKLHNLSHRCMFWCGDLLQPMLEKDIRCDFIVSNPPYISQIEMADLPLDVQCEPQLALAGGEDGLLFYHRLAQEARTVLNSQGLVLVEHGWNQQQAVGKIFKDAGYSIIDEINDYGQRNRGVLVQMTEE